MGKSQDLYKKAKTIIPGGTQLLSKRPEMFLPDYWPAYYEKAKGCKVWDLDGNEYIDSSYMGIGCCVLGYADEDVNNVVTKIVADGNMTTLNPREEVELAELLLSIHTWAGMCRFARTGGEAMAIAIRIARAASEKDKILFCGYHGWHDWYLSSNLSDDKSLDGHLLPGLDPAGVPRGLKNNVHPFLYNDTKSFLDLIEKYRGEIGVIVMESIRNDEPTKEFVDAIMQVSKENNIVLVVDEITAGFRLNVGGAHLKFGLMPDIAVFAKGISNGFPMSAVIGKKEIMEVAQDTFISSTYWTERIGPAAAIATIKKMMKEDVPEHLIRIGKKIQDNWKSIAAKYNLKIHAGGLYPLSHFSFEYDDPMIYKTLFTQFMLEKGYLASTAFYVSLAHTDKIIDEYFIAVDEVFNKISNIIKEGNPKKYLKGPICHSGFKRLT